MRLREHQSRLRLVAATSGVALVLSSLTATAAAAASVDPDDLRLADAQPALASRDEGAKSPSSALATTPKRLLGIESAKKIPVMIKYDVEPVASYTGTVPGYDATSPSVTGETLSTQGAETKKYRGFVRSQQREITAEVEAAVPATDVVGTYETVYGGVAALVPGNRVSELLDVPGVVAVQENVLEQPLTDSSVEYIGAPAAYEALGTEAEAGDGLVLGNIDTGIWPEHPSFADHGNLSPYDGPQLACEFGQDPTTPRDDPFVCNDKLVGGYAFTDLYDLLNPGDYLYRGTARDAEGHGSHTSGTSAGGIVRDVQTVGPQIARIQGVAPGAKIVEYKALGPGGGYTSDLVAAVEQAVVDEVDAINYSISGGTTVDDPVELAFLGAYDAGVFVAASAGNDGPGAATANHVSPWLTTVGASTQDREFSSTLSLTAGDGETFTVDGASIVPGVAEPLPVVRAGDAPYSDPLCQEPAPAGTFDGVIVVCERGENARVLKGHNVLQGGAAGMVLVNPTLADVATDNHFLPAVHVADGTELAAFLESHDDVTGSFTDGAPAEGQGDVMAAFSSRGPAGPFVKPDVTAPGVQILAAMTPTPLSAEGGLPGQYYQAIQGTSMSSPHVAGVGLLLQAAHPDWTPGQIKSAMMTQARTDIVKEDLTTPADPFDMGAGHVDVGASLTPPVTISDTTENFAALAADPVHAVDLNVPSINAPTLPGRLTTTRTLENTSGRPLVVHPRAEAPDGAKITFSPRIATVRPGKSVDFDITITDTSASEEQKFGAVTFRTQRGDARIPVAFVPTQGNVAVDQSCDAEKIPLRGDVTCTVTATNESFTAQTVTSTTSGTGALRGSTTESAELAGAELGVPSVEDVPEGSPAGGFADLESFGIAPRAVGDEELVNFTVPAFSYNGRTYSSVGVDTNGYLVAGGGTSQDNECCTLPDGPSPARPNDVLAPFWTDLNGVAGDGTQAEGIRAGTLTDGVNDWLVLQWDVFVWGTQDARAFQVWIGLNGTQDVSFTYADAMADPNGMPFLVGAENAGGQGDMVAELPDGTDKVVTSTDPAPGGTLTYDVTLRPRFPGKGLVRTELVADEVPGVTVVETPVRVTVFGR
ncbi:S8 family serine peptidase [Isoptericola cucumis]|uniref:Peptidase S8 n=1 Tax=Isoptericola cucumis TaxID=1776856 RepID=A0ABQ2B917_9MICO|nr:S8 family serine peptidase [Isoptericola cucumis]GGI10919.1 peptidase S8 [Isoptericola cucumis]